MPVIIYAIKNGVHEVKQQVDLIVFCLNYAGDE